MSMEFSQLREVQSIKLKYKGLTRSITPVSIKITAEKCQEF
jgi:hypothetical protein